MKSPVFTFLTGLLLLPLWSYAQINDCEDAFVVCDNGHLFFNPDGPGLDDYADPDNYEGCITSLEQNSAWYYFQIDPAAPPDLVLGFIIHPDGGLGEDYDWALYGPDVVCGDLGFPIRCSSSSAACGFCPETGMGMGTTDFTEGPGTGDGFVSTLVVQPGQGFYLMIDNWLGTSNGFTLEWTDTAAPYLNCTASPPCALEANAGPDFSACEGDNVSLNGTSTGGHGNVTYSWSGTNGGTSFLNNPNIPNPTINLPSGFNGSIIYTLTVSEDTCNSMDDLELVVNSLPVININQIGPFCPEESPQTLTATPPGGNWSGDATGNTFNPTTNGPGIHTVIYTYTDVNDCSATASIDIEVYESPDVNIDPVPSEFCDSESSVLLTATGSGGAGGYTYMWLTPDGPADGNTYDAMNPGVYTVMVTDNNGCIHSTATTVIIYQNPDVEINDPGLICASTELLTITAIPPGGIFDGSIIALDGEIYPNMELPGTYWITYTYTDNHNCDGSAGLSITIIPVPESIPNNNGPLCEGQPILLTGATNGTGFFIEYIWSGPNGYTSNLQNPVDATLAGNYILQVIIDDCPSAPDTTTVNLYPAPDALALNGGPYCNGGSIQLFGSTGASGNTIAYAWTGPNGYASNLQNPSDAIEAGIYSLVITVDGCASPVAQTIVVFGTPTDAMASNTGPYCQGDSVFLSGNTSSIGNVITYVWTGPNGYQSSVQNPVDASAPGLYQLIIGVDGCQSSIVTTDVIINPSPQPLITGQNAFCTGFSSTLDAGAGYSFYSWNDGSQNQTLQVFTSGTYHVTVTNANGCTGEANFDVTENSSLSPVITGSLAFCAGAGTILDAGAGYSSYVWSDGQTNQTITVTTGGNYGVIVTDTDGCTGSANVTATENANPNVMIGGSSTYCIGGSTVLDAGAGYATYLWSNSSTNQTIIVSSPGILTVDVVDNNGCSGSASVDVYESTSLHPVITGNDKFCENGSTTLNAGTGFATYLWSDGSMNQMLNVNVAGNYSVTVSDGQGCSGDTVVVVSEVSPPAAQVTPTATLCNTTAGGSIINLYAQLISGDMNGSWQDADNSGAVGLFINLNFNGVPAGDYHFIYTTNSAIDPCPETSYQVIVTILDCACPDVLFFNANPLCNSGEILNLTSIENTTEPGNWTILQTPAGSNPAVLSGNIFDPTGRDPGDYVLQFSLQNVPPPGCPADFQVMVHVDPSVDAGVANAPVAYCFKENQSVSLIGLITGADTNGTWTETSVSPSQGSAFNAVNGTFATVSQLPGTYTFEYTLMSQGVCPDDASEVSVVINPLPTTNVVDDVVIDCTNPTQILDASGSSSGPVYDIVWSGPGIISNGNENTLHPSIDQAGDYLLTITNNVTGCSNTALIHVTANTDAPTNALMDNHDPGCFGDQDGYIHIENVSGGNPPFLYSLNNAPFGSSPNFDNLPAGNHVIIVQDANGCRWDTMIVMTEPSEVNIDLGPDIELALGEIATVQALVNLSSDQIDTIIWTPADIIECIDQVCLEATVHTANTVTLNATVVDLNGCRDSDNMTITINKQRRIFIPSIFSPNNDGINDIFFISGDAGQINIIHKFVIYDRWGNVLHEATNFSPNDASRGWDGHFKNESLNSGVFTYVAKIEYIDGVSEVIAGDITLLR